MLRQDEANGLEFRLQWNSVDKSLNSDKSRKLRKPVWLADSLVANNWVRATTKTNQATVSVKVPKGTSRLSVVGAVDVDHSEFSVTITPPAFDQPQFLGSAFNRHTVQNISMYDTILDPKVEYHVEVRNLGPDKAYFDLSQFHFFRPKESGGGGGLSTGAIVGIAVGGAAAVGLAALAGWLLYRRRKRQAEPLNRVDIESETDNVAHTVVPYHDEHPGAPMAQAAHVASGALRPAGQPYNPPASVLGSTLYTGGSGGVSGGGSAGPLSSYQSSASTSEPLLSQSSHYSHMAPLTVHNPDEHFGAHAHAPSSSAHTVGIAAINAKNASPPVTVQHVHHVDGGVVPQPQPQPSSVVVEETPPTYDPTWAPASTSGASEAPRNEKGH